MSFHLPLVDTTQFLLRKFLELKWTPQLIIDDTKLLSIDVENLYLLDSLNFLPMSIKRLSKSFDVTCRKGYYPQFFNTADNLEYVSP
jgi:hypothetical protein